MNWSYRVTQQEERVRKALEYERESANYLATAQLRYDGAVQDRIEVEATLKYAKQMKAAGNA